MNGRIRHGPVVHNEEQHEWEREIAAQIARETLSNRMWEFITFKPRFWGKKKRLAQACTLMDEARDEIRLLRGLVPTTRPFLEKDEDKEDD